MRLVLLICVWCTVLSPSRVESVELVLDILSDQCEVNVIIMDMNALIGFWYLQSSTYSQYIGELLGDVLMGMMDYGVNATDIHLVGHSMGAHVAGVAGRTVSVTRGTPLGRITGLDPTIICYSNTDNAWRLDYSDAELVDIVHTDGLIGLSETIGHVDFYVNGGSQQEGCLTTSCDHARAWMYFAESILDPTALQGQLCDSWALFKDGGCSNNSINYIGLEASSSIQGKFYLQTNSESPYGRGEDGLTYQTTFTGILSLFRLI